MDQTVAHAQQHPRDWFTVADTAAETQLGSKAVYAAINRGDLHAARVGRSIRIHRTWIADWLFSTAEGR